MYRELDRWKNCSMSSKQSDGLSRNNKIVTCRIGTGVLMLQTATVLRINFTHLSWTPHFSNSWRGQTLNAWGLKHELFIHNGGRWRGLPPQQGHDWVRAPCSYVNKVLLSHQHLVHAAYGQLEGQGSCSSASRNASSLWF